MKAINIQPNFHFLAPGSLGARVERSAKSSSPARFNGVRQPTLMERFDRWLWNQHVRDREAYLADAKDIYELEERIRQLDRSVSGRYY
jgi:hypothetical protein